MEILITMLHWNIMKEGLSELTDGLKNTEYSLFYTT